MTDKVQKLLDEITVRKLCTMDEHMAFYNDKAKEDYSFLSEMEKLIKALQEEPVSEEFEDALAREWQGYNDRGAATVDALEDNSQELAFAKGFYRGAEWGKNQAKVEIQAQSMALAHGCPKEPARGLTKEVVKGASTGGMLIKVPQSTLDTLDIVAGDKINIQIRKV